MSSAPRLQTELSQKRDIPSWVLISLTAIIAVGSSYATLQVTTAANATTTQENTLQIHDLQQTTVKTREMDRVYEQLKEINANLGRLNDKLNDRRR